MGLYETFMLGFAVLVIVAGVVFSVAAAFTPDPQRYQPPTPPNSAAPGDGGEGGRHRHANRDQAEGPNLDNTFKLTRAPTLNFFMAVLSVNSPTTWLRGFGVPFLPPFFSMRCATP